MASTSHSKQKEGNVVTWHVPTPQQSVADSAHVTTALLEKFKWDILDHPPNSPDLTPSDFHLFLHLKKHLAGKKFDDYDEVQEEVMTWFKGQAADFYDLGIQKLVPRLNVWTMPVTMLKNKFLYRQFIHSIAFVN
jgi:hypothetical protein